jgi:hypothetical protein
MAAAQDGHQYGKPAYILHNPPPFLSRSVIIIVVPLDDKPHLSILNAGKGQQAISGASLPDVIEDSQLVGQGKSFAGVA